jgi:hypothetical protein
VVGQCVGSFVAPAHQTFLSSVPLVEHYEVEPHLVGRAFARPIEIIVPEILLFRFVKSLNIVAHSCAFFFVWLTYKVEGKRKMLAISWTPVCISISIFIFPISIFSNSFIFIRN